MNKDRKGKYNQIHTIVFYLCDIYPCSSLMPSPTGSASMVHSQQETPSRSWSSCRKSFIAEVPVLFLTDTGRCWFMTWETLSTAQFGMELHTILNTDHRDWGSWHTLYRSWYALYNNDKHLALSRTYAQIPTSPAWARSNQQWPSFMESLMRRNSCVVSSAMSAFLLLWCSSNGWAPLVKRR